MKRIIAIVRPEKMEELKDALFAADVSGMTIAQVMGCGNQHGWSEYFRGTEVLLNMLPKVKFELVVADAKRPPPEMSAMAKSSSAPSRRSSASAPASAANRQSSQ